VEALNPFSFKGHHPRTGPQNAGNGFKKGGLPRSVASQQGDDFSFFNSECYSTEGWKISVKGMNSFKVQQHIRPKSLEKGISDRWTKPSTLKFSIYNFLLSLSNILALGVIVEDVILV
jgi:hypothetical protein